jgi:hypothetical protein
MVVGQWPILICHRWWRFARSFVKEAAPKAHPNMTNDNWPLTNDHFSERDLEISIKSGPGHPVPIFHER